MKPSLGAWLTVFVVSVSQPVAAQNSNLATVADLEQAVDAACATDSSSLTTAVAKVAEVMPSNWTVRIDVGAIPVNHDAAQGVGTSLAFEGTEKSVTPGRTPFGQKRESVTLWLMPSNYVPRLTADATGAGGFFVRMAPMLGSNSSWKVFCTMPSGGLPTWPNWRRDVASALAIELSLGSGNRPPAHFVCPDVTKCVLLGSFRTTNGVVHALEFDPLDPTFHRVRGRDMVGDYVLDDDEIWRDGSQKVVLRKGNETVVVSRESDGK